MTIVKPRVAIAMGSQSDLPTMSDACKALEKFGISFVTLILSAHRTPADVATFASQAREQGLQVIIAGAGGAAHLPGMIAAYTSLPVIGVPVSLGQLGGQDALYSIVQMPKGVPVATVGIGNAWNAGILAAQILSIADKKIQHALTEFKQEMISDVQKSRGALSV